MGARRKGFDVIKSRHRTRRRIVLELLDVG